MRPSRRSRRFWNVAVACGSHMLQIATKSLMHGRAVCQPAAAAAVSHVVSSCRGGMFRCTVHAANARFDKCACANQLSGATVSSSSSSSWSSELVTRTVLQATAAAAAAGLPPHGVSELMVPSCSGSSNLAVAEVGDLDGPTCRRCTVRCLSGEAAEALSDILLGFGAQSVVVQEHRPPGAVEQQIFDDGSGSPLWDLCDVAVHFALEDDAAEILTSAGQILHDAGQLPAAAEGQPLLQYEIEEMANQQWVDQIKASYVPIKLSDSLYIVPEWSEPVDPSAVNIILQPGVAFGTGEHPTTRLCLLALEGMQLAGRTIMDYGAGSGVLALAALKRGAAAAVGTDTDGLAVRAARRNAQLNGLAERFMVVQCGPSMDDEEPMVQAGLPPMQFDLVVANILRGPLVDLMPRLAGYAAPGGSLLLSGILTEQAPEIIQAYSCDFEGFQVQSDGSWACIRAVKKA